MRYLAVLGVACLICSTALAETERECQVRVGAACYSVEKTKPDSSRNGVSALDACTLKAIVACSRR